jgi:hypothetical protein
MSNTITGTEHISNSSGIEGASANNQLTEIARLESIRDKLPTLRSNIVNRNGITSGTANTWTQVAVANTSRNGFFIQNISDVTIEIGLGTIGNEFPVYKIAPEGYYSFAGVIPPDRIVVRCPTAISKSFYASEA